MYPKTVEGLPEKGVLAESGLSPEAAAAVVGSGEQARRQWHRIYEREGGVVGSKRKEFLPEVLLELPEVGCLPGEGGPMYLVESGEPSSVVTAEEEVDALVGVEPEELSYDLDGENLRVAELGRRSTTSDTPSFDLVIHEAEDGHDEGANIHERKTSFYSRWIGAPPRVGRSSLWLKSSKETCTQG